VTYQTPSDTLANIPALVKEIILREPDVIFDRGHFSAFGPSSLNFEFVYYILSSDYIMYVDRQQAIYLSIFREFEARGIEFAYPTQTLFITADTSKTVMK
jgi:small-conductance mechanosensitive channel